MRPISQDLFIEEPKPTDDPHIHGSALQTPHSVHSEALQVGSARKGFTTEMFVTSEKYPGRAQTSAGDLEPALATPVLVTDRDHSLFSSPGCAACGEVLCPPGCGHVAVPEPGRLCRQESKQCLLVLPSRLLKHCFGGCVMVLECDSV